MGGLTWKENKRRVGLGSFLKPKGKRTGGTKGMPMKKAHSDGGVWFNEKRGRVARGYFHGRTYAGK